MTRYRINPRLLKSEPLRRCALDECQAACCLHGTWVDLLAIEDILAHAALIAPHMPVEVANPADWFDGRRTQDAHALNGVMGHTTVLPDAEHHGGTACVFLRSDYKCALQAAAVQEGLHPWRFKPFYCILHPLDLDDQDRITLDKTELLLAEPGSCLRKADEPIPLIEIFREELRYLLGEEGYHQIKTVD